MKTEQQNFKGFRWTVQDTEPILTRLIKASKEGFLKAGEVKKIISDHLGRECPFSPRVADAFSRDFPDVVVEEQGRCAGKRYRFSCKSLIEKNTAALKYENKKGFRRSFSRDNEALPATACSLLLGNSGKMEISSLIAGLRMNTFHSFNVSRSELEKISKECGNYSINGETVVYLNSENIQAPTTCQELWHIPCPATLNKLRQAGITVKETNFGLDEVMQLEYIDSIFNKDLIIEAVLSTRGLGVQPLVTGARKDLWDHLFDVATQRICWWRDPIKHCPDRNVMNQELANLLIRKGERQLFN